MIWRRQRTRQKQCGRRHTTEVEELIRVQKNGGKAKIQQKEVCHRTPPPSPPINRCVKTMNAIIKAANKNIQGTNVKFCEFMARKLNNHS